MGLKANAVVVLGFLSIVAHVPFVHADAVVGSTVEVREGDSWTKVKVVAVEGRRVQVRYDDGTEEWVGPDRLRSGESSPAAPAGGDAGAAKPDRAPARPGARAFSVDQAVEVKRDGRWLAAKVREIGKGWIFVAEEKDQGQKRWIESWAVRVPGSAYDVDGKGTSQWPSQPGKVAPAKPPEPANSPVGDPFVVAPEGERPVTADDLKNNVETAVFEGAAEPVAIKDQPFTLAPTTQPASAEFSAWALRGNENQFKDIFVSPGGGKVAVAAFPGNFGKSTVVTRAGIAAHNQMDTRSLRLPDLRVLSVANDGDLLLTAYVFDKKLQVWEWTGRSYKLVTNLLVDPGQGIKSAAFVSPDKAVVLTMFEGAVHLVDLKEKRIISSLKGAKDAELFVHPSGQLVGVMSGSGTAMLLRSSDFGIIAEFPDSGDYSNVTVDATGRWAAYLTNSGVVRVVNVSDGSQLGVVSVGAGFKGSLDLVDDKFLLVDHKTAYDVKSGIPIWIYKVPDNASVKPLINGQFLIAVPGNKMVSVAVASMPDQVGRVAMKTATPDRFMLKPGMAIKVDGDLGVFVEGKEKATEIVNKVVTGAGMTVSDKDEAFHLAITVAAGPTQKREYAPDIFTPPSERKIMAVEVSCNIATATLSYKGQPCWTQQIRYVAPESLRFDRKKSLQDEVNGWATPKAHALNGLNFPSYLPTGAKPGEPAALGSSTLQERRFVPDQPAKPARPAAK